MEARMKNPAVNDSAMAGIKNLTKAIYSSGAPASVLELVHMRASQINGCSACVFGGAHTARKAGVSDDQLVLLPAWRETDKFSDGERAALELTEAMTRLADNPGAVSDAVFDEAADHFSEDEIGGIILMAALTNFFNRINTTIREPAGATWG